tara:strand:- start:5338 stop:5622 length:285 start_codon:yes stop_codon:yes gene_type:complete
MSLKEIREGWFGYMMYKVSLNRFLNPKIKEEIEIRYSICRECPDLRIKTDKSKSVFQGKCSICKCSFPAIVYSKSKKCPEGKWGAIVESTTPER